MLLLFKDRIVKNLRDEECSFRPIVIQHIQQLARGPKIVSNDLEPKYAGAYVYGPSSNVMATVPGILQSYTPKPRYI